MTEKPCKSFIATLHVRPDKRAEFIALQTELKRLVAEREPDALVYELLELEEDENTFLVVATFRNEEAYEHHMAIDFHERLVPPILDCLASEMELSFARSHG